MDDIKGISLDQMASQYERLRQSTLSFEEKAQRLPAISGRLNGFRRQAKLSMTIEATEDPFARVNKFKSKHASTQGLSKGRYSQDSEGRHAAMQQALGNKHVLDIVNQGKQSMQPYTTKNRNVGNFDIQKDLAASRAGSVVLKPPRLPAGTSEPVSERQVFTRINEKAEKKSRKISITTIS